MNYYNENDPRAAEWLRQLIAARQIPDGFVDERSIIAVQPADIAEFVQCHFFAGIGGWPHALRLAGWPEDKPVWTGSCPCQPFSVAGAAKGESDPRHLWPEFFRLITIGAPATVFGEQVTSKLGREWLARVFADLEGVGYAVAGADLCAASVGAPHIRQRLYWVAVAQSQRSYRSGPARGGRGESSDSGSTGGLANSASSRCIGPIREPESQTRDEARVLVSGERGEDGGMEHATSDGREQRRAASGERGAERGRTSIGLGQSAGEQVGHAGQSWGQSESIPCLDGKARRVESGTFPLAHGVPGRVGLLRGYGNAIVPQVAAQFIRASAEAMNFS